MNKAGRHSCAMLENADAVLELACRRMAAAIAGRRCCPQSPRVPLRARRRPRPMPGGSRAPSCRHRHDLPAAGAQRARRRRAAMLPQGRCPPGGQPTVHAVHERRQWVEYAQGLLCYRSRGGNMYIACTLPGISVTEQRLPARCTARLHCGTRQPRRYARLAARPASAPQAGWLGAPLGAAPPPWSMLGPRRDCRPAPDDQELPCWSCIVDRRQLLQLTL